MLYCLAAVLRDIRPAAPITLGAIARLLVVGFLLTALVTYPTLPGLTTHGRFDTGDGRFSIWNVGWIGHALTTAPADLLDANIFHPHRGALAYSEPNLVAGLLGLPAFLATGGNAVAALNSAVFGGLLLALVSMWLLVRRLTGSEPGAYCAAIGFAFCPYVQAHTAHIQLVLVFGFPLVLLALLRLRARPSVWSGAGLGAALAVAALSSGYYGFFAALMLAVVVVGWVTTDRRYWLALGAAGVVCLSLVLPVLVPYRAARVAVDAGAGVALDEAHTYAATVGTYLSSPAHAHQWLPAAAESVFPGFATLMLAAVGIWASVRRTPEDRRTVAVLGVVVVLAAWASFGPAAGLYGWLASIVPLMDMLRAPVRLGIVVTFALAVIAGFGARHLLAGRPLLAVAVIGLMTMELLAVPWPLRPEPPVPGAYRTLAGLARGPLVEFPFPYRRADFHEHTRAMVGSIHHWQPLVNGYSDVTPPGFEALALELSAFPDPVSFEVMRKLGVRYVLWHLDRYNDEARVRLLARFAPYQDRLRTLADDGRVRLVEIVDGPAPPGMGAR
ncbi:MAG TPA: hypothetical protein VMM93_04615 [Vicinamibacterales bacterium]|nr:hypothetical protein [Vicinamibacterales bacterium]